MSSIQPAAFLAGIECYPDASFSVLLEQPLSKGLGQISDAACIMTSLPAGGSMPAPSGLLRLMHVLMHVLMPVLMLVLMLVLMQH